MIRLLYFISCALFVSSVHADIFRVYEVLADRSWVETMTSKEALIQAAGKGSSAQLLAYGGLEESEPGVWSMDQTYTLEYFETVERENPVSRQVGLSVKISEVADGLFKLEYAHTRLKEWKRFGKDGEGLQPIFETREFSHTGPIEGIAMHGGLVVGDSIELYLIERVLEN